MLERGDVKEDVGRAVSRRHEPVTLLLVEPLDLAPKLGQRPAPAGRARRHAIVHERSLDLRENSSGCPLADCPLEPEIAQHAPSPLPPESRQRPTAVTLSAEW